MEDFGEKVKKGKITAAVNRKRVGKSLLGEQKKGRILLTIAGSIQQERQVVDDLKEVVVPRFDHEDIEQIILEERESKVLKAACGVADQTIICPEILDKGELQVAGKERDSQLSNQFKDIATIVMQTTINAETRCPYTVSMIEHLMHEVHFAVDPNSTSKKQAQDVILELQNIIPSRGPP